MIETKKRVRLTDTRVRRWMQFQRTITATWRDAIRYQHPTQQVFAKLSEQIHALDITAECMRDLSARNWGARDLVESEHAEWCLYLDGKRSTSSEAFALGRHNDLCGRFEYRGTGKPFYTSGDPEPLSKGTP